MPVDRQSFTDWSTNNLLGPSQGSMNLGPAPQVRDPKDRLLQAFGNTPDTQYPDGYLGNTNSRRDGGVVRSTVKPYERGVHKGERVNPGDYLWPDEFNPNTGLQLEARGLKYAPSGQIPAMLVNDGKPGPQDGVVVDREHLALIDAERRGRLKSQLPSWR